MCINKNLSQLIVLQLCKVTTFEKNHFRALYIESSFHWLGSWDKRGCGKLIEFLAKFISKNSIPEAAAASKMVRFSIWGISNLISHAYSVPSSTPKICPGFWASSEIVVLRSKRFLPQNHLKKFASGGHCDLKNAPIFNLRVPKWPRDKSK